MIFYNCGKISRLITSVYIYMLICCYWPTPISHSPYIAIKLKTYRFTINYQFPRHDQRCIDPSY